MIIDCSDQFAYFRDQYANALQRQRPQNGLLDFLKLNLAHLQVSGVGFQCSRLFHTFTQLVN